MVKKKDLLNKRKNLFSIVKDSFTDIVEERKKKEELRLRKTFENYGADYDVVKEKIPLAVDLVKSKGVVDADFNTDEYVAALIADEGFYPGGGCGMEYGIRLYVIRGDEVADTYFKWRDPYSEANDNPAFHFREVSLESITDEQVTVKLKSNELIKEVTFDLKKVDPDFNPSIDSVVDEKFKDYVSSKVDELSDSLYKKDAVMPGYIDTIWAFKGFKGQLPFGTLSKDSSMIPYEKPELVDKFINYKEKEAVVIIRSQIDHSIDGGKQYAFNAYLITEDETRLIDTKVVYQRQMRSGSASDFPKARDLYKKLSENND